MNENLDLTKILEGCPKGTEFYSPIYGKVWFEGIINYIEYPIELTAKNKFSTTNVYYTKEGRYCAVYEGECTLLPSKDQRDWAKFERFWDKPKVEKFDPKTLHPFDKVLIRDYPSEDWAVALYSHLSPLGGIICGSVCFGEIIPYNDETKHLVGTTNDCPEFYKWWEE